LLHVRCFSSNTNDQIAVEANIRRRGLTNYASQGSEFKTGCPGHQPKKMYVKISARNQESCLEIECVDYKKIQSVSKGTQCFSFSAKTSQLRGEVTCPRLRRKLAADQKLETGHWCCQANALLQLRRKPMRAFQIFHLS